MSKRLESIAYHEAGHAVAHFEFNQKIRKVTIVPNKEYDGCCFGYGTLPHLDVVRITPVIREKVEDRIIIYFMGILAERRFLGRSLSIQWTKLNDTREAVDLAFYLTGSVEQCNAYINWLYICAKDLLNSKEKTWKAIEAIAQELLKKKTLSGKEAFQIWRNIYMPPELPPERIVEIQALIKRSEEI
jgi:ATP-dependent Zn protease